jgi:hypothetical protein
MTIRQLDFRSRLIFALGNVCLSSGLMISLLATEFALRHHAAFNFLRFSLLIAAICLNLIAFRNAKRCSGVQR